MRHDHGGKWIVAGLQGLPARRIVAQFDHRKFNPDATAPQALLIAPRSPARAGITQDCQTHHGAVVAIKEPVIIDIYALGKVSVSTALNLRVDQHNLLNAVAPPDLHELVRQAGAQSSIADNLLQIGVETLIATSPVNIGVRLGKEKSHKGREITVEHFFPGAVIVWHQSKSWGGWSLPEHAARAAPVGR